MFRFASPIVRTSAFALAAALALPFSASIASAGSCEKPNAQTSAGCNVASNCGAKTTASAAGQPRDLQAWIAKSPKFSTLHAALKAAGLEDTLRQPGAFTLYAPTNDAFARLPAGKLDELLKPENRATLANILKYHLVPSARTCAQACEAGQLATALGPSLQSRMSEGRSMVNSAIILMPDVPASNGYLHVIDQVLLPPS